MRSILLGVILAALCSCTAQYGPGHPGSEPPIPGSDCDSDSPECKGINPLCTDPSDTLCDGPDS